MPPLTIQEIEAMANEQATKDVLMRKATDTSMTTSPAWAPPVDVPQPTQTVPDSMTIPQWAKQAALPTVGAVGGGMLTGPGGVPMGAMAGESMNQILGITENDPMQIALQGAIPVAGRAVGAGLKAGARVGGSWMAEQLNRLAPEAAATFLAKFAPAANPRGLFESAAASNLNVPVRNLMKTIRKELPNLRAGGAQPEGWQQAAGELTDIRNLIILNGGALPAKDLIRQHQALGELMAGAKGNARRVYANLYHELGDEVDTYITKKGTDTAAAMGIKQAWADYKRQATVNEILTNVKQVTTHLKNQGENVSFNGGRLMDLVEKNRFFDTAFSETEKAEIKSVLGKLNTIPALRPGAGQQFGSGQVMQGLRMGALAGGVTGMVSHNPYLSGAALATGTAIPPIAITVRNIWTAVQTGIGRTLLSELIKAGKGDLTPQAVSILSAFATSTQANPVTAQATEFSSGAP